MPRARRAALALVALLAGGIALGWMLRRARVEGEPGEDGAAGVSDTGPTSRTAALAARPHAAAAQPTVADEKPVAPPPPSKPPNGPMKAPMRVRVALEDPALAAGARVEILAHH